MGRVTFRGKILALKVLCFGGPFLVLLALLNAFFPALKEEYDLRRFGSRAGTVTVDGVHFRLYTELPLAYARELAAGLDRFYGGFVAGYGGRFHLEPGEEKALVYVFRDKEELEKWSRREFHRPMTNNGGFYDPEKREIGIVAGGEELEEDLVSGFHEAVHMAFDAGPGPRARKALSPWLSEGLAVYFGDGVTFAPGSLEWRGEAGRRIAGLIGRIRSEIEESNSPAILSRLISAEPSSFLGPDNEFYYAASYLLVHFLLHAEGGSSGKRLDGLYEMERREGALYRHPEKIFRALGGDEKALERGWRRHARHLLQGIPGG
ncbi:MAG: hypothetical protein HY720_17925 [Planctomycetes bacterium]|nr:hypothetical protein [Planctomycetota bacterium]